MVSFINIRVVVRTMMLIHLLKHGLHRVLNFFHDHLVKFILFLFLLLFAFAFLTRSFCWRNVFVSFFHPIGLFVHGSTLVGCMGAVCSTALAPVRLNKFTWDKAGAYPAYSHVL